MKQINPEVESFARIRVIGVGGSGTNAVNHMIDSKVRGVEFVAVNTDAQDLHHSNAKRKIHIGKNLTRGLGAGGNSDFGKRAAEETKEEVLDVVKGADMIFVACGMGGGTGTGASPVVAQASRESGALTVGVVTKPFSFEGQQRMRVAEMGIEDLKKEVDALIVIPNDRLLAVVDRDTTVQNAFEMCDNILKQAVEGISELITMPGIINVDFADIRSIMENAGSALMGVGVSTGEKRAEEAAAQAINSPLLEISISGAKGVLFAIAGGDDLGMLEVQDAARVITESIDPNAKVIFGAVNDDKLKKNEVKVTVIATGFPEGALTRGSSLFAGAKKDEEKEAGQIHSSIDIERIIRPVRPAKAPEELKKEEKQEENKENKLKDEDDGGWSAFLVFLRRSKWKERKKRKKAPTPPLSYVESMC